ncbi:MAG: hypothetical protein LAO20_05950 [Acidobacteriia bacterium]|nr:hypothetical protein [Terriglobia bacterium]
MKIKHLAVFLLCLAPLCSFAQPKVRFVTDLKKGSMYESFGRAAKGKAAWKSQQGIAFLSKDLVAVYQLRQSSGDANRFLLNIGIVDAHNGHEGGFLQLPAADRSAAVMAVQDGKFLARAGDSLYLYSIGRERLATKDLPASNPGQFDEWQVDVTPSGATVVLARQKPLSGEAEIELLESNSLSSIKKFTVAHLDRWSASDNFLIAADPAAEPGEAEMGVLDFDGHWRRLRTGAESDDPDCRYNMLALERGLIAAYDCDDLLLVSNSGAVVLSNPSRPGEFIASVAGARSYFAEVLVPEETGRPYIAVHDVTSRAERLHVFLQRGNFYYSVSPDGALAVIEGDELKVYEGQPASEGKTGTVAAAAPGVKAHLRWRLDLDDEYGFSTFTSASKSTWMKQHDVLFLSPERLLVYQVSQVAPAEGPVLLEGQVPGTSFTLEAKVLDAQDGHEIKSLKIPTTSGFSKIIATRDGKFAVRAGDFLYLYSADFEKLASRELPLKGKALAEGWQIGVSPNGEELALVHQQIFSPALPPPIAADRLGVAEFEILNADTLQPAKSFTVPHYLNWWSAGDGYLLAANPQEPPGKQHFVRMGFDGQWSTLNPEWDPAAGCQVQMDQLQQERIVFYGCGNVLVRAASGYNLLSVAENVSQGVAASATGAGKYLAVGFGRYDMGPFRPQVGSPNLVRPMLIEVYDLATAKTVMSVPVRSENSYYAISPQGTLAVVDGPVLAVFQPEP